MQSTMPSGWSAVGRAGQIKKAAGEEYDVVIIGGGITGAGIARECALRGISFCLVEKRDFAFGTSSRSSKLFHGGIRYLSSHEFGLVRESTTERNWLLHHLPNLVRPLGFMYCAYEKGKDRPIMVKVGVKLYEIFSDWCSDFKNFRKSRIFKKDFVEEFEPALETESPELGKLLLAGFYYDTNCDDARVTLEIIKESLEYAAGNSVALSYARVEGYRLDSSGRARGVVVRDELDGGSFEVRGRVVVSATGIWTDELLGKAGYGRTTIYPTKGVHIIVPNERIGNRNAFGLRSFDDGRFFFVLRREKVTVIGTTDTAYYPESRNLDEPWCKKEDCDYLLRTVNRMFPHARLTYDDVIGTFAGIRPLIKQEGAKHESDVSRTHEIMATDNGVVAIAGGKSTTHRRMAEELLFYLVDEGYLPGFKRPEHSRRGYSKVPFKVGISRREFDAALTAGGLHEVSWPEQTDYLYRQFGRQGVGILERIRKDPESGQPLLEGYPHCRAEIEFILEYENAPKLIDVLCRRTEAQWMIWHYKQPRLAAEVAAIMASFYGWSAERREAEIGEYLTYVENTVRFIREN
ncbi:MAG: glycerol-3-phosphate dehydrogenase/oxidase [Firmicutes bacterium]|nr:glycerol-3-phosphate dehydrogenase/oxidase [Bacillota bacterium]